LNAQRDHKSAHLVAHRKPTTRVVMCRRPVMMLFTFVGKPLNELGPAHGAVAVEVHIVQQPQPPLAPRRHAEAAHVQARSKRVAWTESFVRESRCTSTQIPDRAPSCPSHPSYLHLLSSLFSGPPPFPSLLHLLVFPHLSRSDGSSSASMSPEASRSCKSK